ncbi:pseudouridylate synthase, partial [Rhizobium johnstonii]
LPKGAVRALSEPELQALRRKTGMERTRRN